MNGSQRRGQHAEINHSTTDARDKHKAAEIAISSDENTALLPGNAKQVRVGRLCQAELSGRDDVVPQSLEELDCRHVNILIRKQFHGAGVAT